MSKPFERILSALRKLDAEDLDIPDDEKFLENALLIADDVRKGIAHKTPFDPELIAVLLIQLQDEEQRLQRANTDSAISGYA